MKWEEAMDRFGSDKPDLRIPFELKLVDNAVVNSEFKVLSGAPNVVISTSVVVSPLVIDCNCLSVILVPI